MFFFSHLYSTLLKLYSTLLYYTILYSTVLFNALLHYSKLCTAMSSYALLCYALYSALLCSAFLRSALLSSTLLYSSILHHIELCICTLREPWAECPRILQQLSYNLHRKNNTESCQRTPRIHPENLKIPSLTTPKKHLKMYLKSTLGAPLEPTLKKAP